MIEITELLKKSSPETAFIILICRVFLGTAGDKDLDAFHNKSGPGINPDRVYNLLKRHRIRPLAHRVLSRWSKQNFPGLNAKLDRDAKNITFRALNDLKEMMRVISVLDTQHVPVLPYRGPLFSKMYYGDWVMRESSDLDFLIDKKHLKALDLFKNEGYKAKHVYNDYRDTDIHWNSMSIDLNNDDGDKRNFHLEFHYNIVAATYGINSGYEDVQAAQASFAVGGQAIRVLSDESSTAIVLAHHGLQDIWGSLKYYMDLAVLVKAGSETDWKKVEAFTRKHGYCKLSAAAFRNVELLTGIKNPFSWQDNDIAFADRVLDLCLSPEKYQHKGFYKLRLRVDGRDSMAWKLKMIGGLLTLFFRPSTDDFEWRYFPPYLFLLYYVCKPPRMIYKYLLSPLIGKKQVFPFR